MNWDIAIVAAIMFHAWKNDLNEVRKTLMFRGARRWRKYHPIIQAKITIGIERTIVVLTKASQILKEIRTRSKG